MFCLLMLFMITYARGQPRGPLHNTSILCTGWRVTAYMMCRHLHSLGHGPCPCLYLSENLSYCPLGAYPIPCKGARVKLLREWGDGPWTCYFMWLNALIAASKSIFRGGSGKAPHSPHPTPPQEVSGPKCGGEGTYWEKWRAFQTEELWPCTFSWVQDAVSLDTVLREKDGNPTTQEWGLPASPGPPGLLHLSTESFFLMLPRLLWHPLPCCLVNRLSPPANSVHQWSTVCILFPHWLYLAHSGIP